MVDLVDDSGLNLTLEASASKCLDKETQVVVVGIQEEPEAAGVMEVVMAVVMAVVMVVVMAVVGIQQLVVVEVVMMAQGTGWDTHHTLCS